MARVLHERVSMFNAQSLASAVWAFAAAGSVDEGLFAMLAPVAI